MKILRAMPNSFTMMRMAMVTEMPLSPHTSVVKGKAMSPMIKIAMTLMTISIPMRQRFVTKKTMTVTRPLMIWTWMSLTSDMVPRPRGDGFGSGGEIRV